MLHEDLQFASFVIVVMNLRGLRMNCYRWHNMLWRTHNKNVHANLWLWSRKVSVSASTRSRKASWTITADCTRGVKQTHASPSSCQRSDRTHNCRQTLLNVARDTSVMCYMSCTCTHMFAALYLRFHTSSDLSQQSSTHVDVHMFVLSRAIAQANDVQRDRISIM